MTKILFEIPCTCTNCWKNEAKIMIFSKSFWDGELIDFRCLECMKNMEKKQK